MCSCKQCCIEINGSVFTQQWSEWETRLLCSSLLLQISGVFLHQGYFHLFLCFVISCGSLLSTFTPRCVRLSFSFLIRLAAFVACHQSFEVFSLSFCERRDVVFISLLHKFVIFFSLFVITFYHCGVFFFLSLSLYKSTQPISNGSVGFYFFSASPISVSESTWMIMFSGFY